MSAVHLVALVAHPDDAELAFGGLLARAAQLGLVTSILDLTAGEAGRRGTAPIRREEAWAAALRLGVRLREGLGWPDGNLADVPRAAERLAEHLTRLDPALVLGHSPLDPHPDHRAASTWVQGALDLAGLSTPTLAGAPARAPGDVVVPAPDWVLRLTRAEAAAKWDAIRCHRSQLEPKDPSDLGQHLPGGKNILLRAQETAAHYGGPEGAGEPLWLGRGDGLGQLRELGLL